MHIDQKPLIWLRSEVKSPPFTEEARIEAGMLLRQLQCGDNLSLPASRPMPSIGKNCHELRVVDANKTWRIVYCVHSLAIVILYVFAKTTTQTPQSAIDLSKARLKEFLTRIHQEEA
jgi:phage-related protein